MLCAFAPAAAEVSAHGAHRSFIVHAQVHLQKFFLLAAVDGQHAVIRDLMNRLAVFVIHFVDRFLFLLGSWTITA